MREELSEIAQTTLFHYEESRTTYTWMQAQLH